MIENIFNLLEFAKKQKWTGNHINIALGKNKYPESVKEAYKQFKKELWQDSMK